jgi:hypothetical protein
MKEIKKYWWLIVLGIILLMPKKVQADKDSPVVKTLGFGDRGESVKTLQRFINKNLSSGKVKVDGIYGKETASALFIILEWNKKLDENYIRIDDEKVVEIQQDWFYKAI